MAQLAYQEIGHAGAAITSQAPGGLGDFVQPDTRGFLWVKNGSGGTTTVAIVVPGTTFGQANPDISVVVAAGAERMFGPLAEELTGDPAVGLLVTCTPAASITIAAVRLSAPPPDLP